jgi:hypothetical protein
MTKNKKTIFKGELGYGTKKIAFDDMKKDNTEFDNLNYIFDGDCGKGWCESDFNVDEILEITELDWD